MKKFILIYDDGDNISSFNTLRELTHYTEAFGIKTYIISLFYKEV